MNVKKSIGNNIFYFLDALIQKTAYLNAKEFQQPTLDILKRKNSYYTMTLTQGVWYLQLVLYDSLILVSLQNYHLKLLTIILKVFWDLPNLSKTFISESNNDRPIREDQEK